jgi:hypothetical protein
LGELRELTWEFFEPAQDEELLGWLNVTRSVWRSTGGDPKTAKSKAPAPVIPQLASDDSPTGKNDVLLRLLRRRVFTGRRHNSLEPQIRDHVPIVLIRVRRID